MKSLWYLLGLALIFWLGVYSIIGIWAVLLMLLGGLILIGVFYILLDKGK